MMEELLAEIRKSSMWMAAFGGAFVVMYLALVLFSKFAFGFFIGFTPDIDRNIIRLVFYGGSACAVLASQYVKKRRSSPDILKKKVSNEHVLLKHIFSTVLICILISEVPLIAGFFMFFLSAMYFDFFALAALSIVLIVVNTPPVAFWAERISKAR